MTEYDFSPEAYEAYQKKIKGVGKWAVETSRFNGDFPSPFAPSPAETRRPLNKDNAAGSDSDSDLTSCSRRRRPVHPKSLTQWPGSRSRAPTPRQLQAPPPPLPPALGQRPPPVRSHTLPNQIYVPTPSPRIQQPQPQYPYPVQRPVVYNPPQQPVITQQQQQSKIYVPRIPKRTNTTPSKPLVSQYPHGVPVKSAGASPYATPVSSPYGSATYPSPRTPSKNWLSRMLGSLSIRGRSASPAPMYNSGRGPGNYESTTRHPRSKSLDPAGYRSEHHRERDREKDNRSEQTRRSRSTRSTRHHRHSDDSDREHGYRRHYDRGRDRERGGDRHHRRARSDVGHR